ncbi:MAG: hypothetical protein EX271_02035 [Acidimicrobiales bacterium]|nr:hypothetical protein [Hyphomonadaceae bacterium]RZV44328.1 MAG: hypothetical protein EX271_02035 [Acidimicrobiales bacterium]
MTAQFIVAFIVFVLAVILSADLWLRVLKQNEFQNITNFYRRGFVTLVCGLTLLIWIQIFNLANFNVTVALFQGVSAAFTVFILFAWGRLTALGLKLDATHQLSVE